MNRRTLSFLRARWIPLLVMAMVMVAASSSRASAQPGASLALPQLETWELNNGMKVAFMPLASAPVVAVEVWYHVGSKDEPRDRRGSAHMFEHMMFKGAERVRPEEHARSLNRLGGYVNASTSEDATWYINVLPARHLDFACQLEAERMRALLFREDMIRTEREVVKEEIRQQENNPLAKGFLRFMANAFSRHPYQWSAGGTIADLDATTAADLKRFYDTYYVPNNAMLVVVGAVTADQVRAAAEKWFGPLPRAAEPPRPADAATEPTQTAMRRDVSAPGQVGLLLGGYHIPAASHDDIYALQVASLILGSGESSRLMQRLVQKERIAVQAGAPLILREHPGLLALYGVYLDASKGDAVQAALLDEIALLRRNGPTVQELSKAKSQIQTSFVQGLQTAAGLAEQIGSSWILTGDPGRWLQDLERYGAVTAADVKRVANTYLTESNLTVLAIPPVGASSSR